MPAPSESTLRALVERVHRGGEDEAPRVIAVESPPEWDGPSRWEVGGSPVEVRPGISVLGIRDLLAERDGDGDGTLLILTSLPETELGTELLTRFWKHRVLRISGWDAVKELFRVEAVDPALARHRWMVDLLVAVAPRRGYPPAPGGLLDLDTAWRNLLRFGLGLESEQPDLRDLLSWGETDEARAALEHHVGGALEPITDRLARTAGPAVSHVLRLVQAGRGGDLVPLGLVADVLWAQDDGEDGAGLLAARVRFEQPVGAKGITGEVGRAWAAAARKLVRRASELSEEVRVQGWLNRAEALLGGVLGAPELAHRSDLLPSAFEQRLDAAGRALEVAVAHPGDPGAVAAVRDAVARVGAHLRARDGDDRERTRRLRMAARLVRRLAPGDGEGDEGKGSGDLAAAARAFVAHGAWVDRAREAVSHGEVREEAAAAYGAILGRIDGERMRRDETFARHLAAWASVEPGERPPLLPVERVLDQVVVPFAREVPVLFLVLDGWSHPEATRLAEDLSRRGLDRLRPIGREHPLVVSGLPSVTSVSRTSLLTGQRAHGTQADERRGWAEHPGLRSVSRRRAAKLFHRRDLAIQEGRIAPEVRDAITSADIQVVGVVVNALDEHLDKGGQLRLADGLQGIRPLRPLVEAALEANRLVVLASDHGHVLEAGSQVRLHGGSGERWRPNHPPAEAGEVELAGPRVLLDNGSIVVPATERLRYMSAEKRGYHGGATPQEVLCPLLVMAPPTLEVSGWEPAETLPPAWWEVDPERWRLPGEGGEEEWAGPGAGAGQGGGSRAGASGAGSAGARAARRRGGAPAADPTGQGMLFPEPVEEGAGVGDGGEGVEADGPWWISELLAGSVLEAQRHLSARMVLADEDLAAFLRILDRANGRLPVQALADELGIPQSRVRTKLQALQRMLNVDGVGVVRVEAQRTVHLDRRLLFQQFGLDR
ncbi:MAG: BREX-2 system phosphatase PglZ [Gemmatimonadales bacterium]|nr:MAG: BREX-2 system phosphatase PglZ [Gemmatimonadales bacterium]